MANTNKTVWFNQAWNDCGSLMAPSGGQTRSRRFRILKRFTRTGASKIPPWSSSGSALHAGLRRQEKGQCYLFTVEHLDILDDAAVFLQNRDGLGQRHAWRQVQEPGSVPSLHQLNFTSTYRGQIPIARFLAISQAPLPDPALASSGGSSHRSKPGFRVPLRADLCQ